MDVRRRLTVNRPVWFALSPLLPLGMSATLVLAAVSSGVTAGEPTSKVQPPPKPAASRPDEPRAETLSLARSAAFLDGVTLAWLRERKCASCHTGFPYLLARQALNDPKAPAPLEVRRFLEERVAEWDKGGKGAGYLKGGGSLKSSEGVTEVVAIAATLAMHDPGANCTRSGLAQDQPACFGPLVHPFRERGSGPLYHQRRDGLCRAGVESL